MRPHKCRFIDLDPEITIFKPRGVPSYALQTVELRFDELEAIRLADLEGLYHEDAGKKMGVSRATFGRLLQSARRTVTDALVNGKCVVFKGGNFAVPKNRLQRHFKCEDCEQIMSIPWGVERPGKCSECGSAKMRRLEKGGGNRGEKRGGKSRNASKSTD